MTSTIAVMIGKYKLYRVLQDYANWFYKSSEKNQCYRISGPNLEIVNKAGFLDVSGQTCYF